MEVTTGFRPTVPKSINPADKNLYDQLEKYVAEEKYQQALKLVDDSIGVRKQDPAFLIVASQVYRSASQHGQERECLEKLVEISPKALHKYLLAECLSAIEDYPASLKILHDILDSNTASQEVTFDALKSMGNIYLKCGDIDAAEEKYNQASRINPTDNALIVNYGVLAIQKGEYDKAKEKFSEAIHVDGKYDVAWVGLALVHRAHSDSDLSRACLLRALDENNTNKIALVHYYHWCLEDGVEFNPSYLDHYLNIYPNDVEVQKLYSSLNS